MSFHIWFSLIGVCFLVGITVVKENRHRPHTLACARDTQIDAALDAAVPHSDSLINW